MSARTTLPVPHGPFLRAAFSRSGDSAVRDHRFDAGRGDVSLSPRLRFDDRGDRAAYEKARAQLARDRAAQADLDRQLKRAQELRAQNFIAQSAVGSWPAFCAADGLTST